MKKITFLLFIIISFYILEAKSTPLSNISKIATISIEPNQISGKLLEDFAGFAFDTAQFTGAKWWEIGSKEHVSAETPYLESPKLRKLVSYLSPSIMRIGGTDCDAAYFCAEEGDCSIPETYVDPYRSNEKKESFLTREDIRRASEFAEAVNAKIIFCINMGKGPRDPITGEWNSENARSLIRYAKSLPYGNRFQMWEAGNEVDVISFNFKTPKWITPQIFAEDLKKFKKLINEEDYGAKIVAPSSYFVPLTFVGDFNFTAKLMPIAFEYIDILSFHLYATQSERCPYPHPASKRTLFDESILKMNRGFVKYVKDASNGLTVINGESASAQCGGQNGVSDTLLDALWYADWIGVMTEEGSEAVIRQTLVGSDYGMLEPDNYNPRPTFLALVMMNRMLAKYRLKTIADRNQILAHAFCNKDRDGSLSLILSNPKIYSIETEISVKNTEVISGKKWVLGANGDLTSKNASIEGEYPLEDGTIPNPQGSILSIKNGKVYITIEPNSLVFAKITPKLKNNLCVW